MYSKVVPIKTPESTASPKKKKKPSHSYNNRKITVIGLETWRWKANLKKNYVN